MSGGKQTTQQTSESAPWGPSQAPLKGNIRLAQDLMNAGVGAQPNSISTAIPFDAATSRGMSYMDDVARRNMSGGLAAAGNQVMASGGLNPLQTSATNTMSANLANLQPFATGDNLGEQNPLFRQSVNNALSDARDQIDMTMSGQGRYGSGSHAGVLSDRLGRIATDAFAGQYNRDRDAMLQANQMQSGIAGNMFNAGQTGFGNLGQAYDYTMRPAEALMQTGAMREGLEANVRQDMIDRHDRTQMAPWENLARANAIFSGAGSLGGTSSGTATAPGQSPFATGLGYGLGGLGLLGAF